MRIYTVVTVDDYIPHVQLSTPDRDRALNYAREWAGDWDNEVTGCAGEVYFNQKEDGSMEYAVSVQENEVTYPEIDPEIRKRIGDIAQVIFNNDGIEEFVPEMLDFSREAVDDWAASTLLDDIHIQVGNYAAFGAMLLGISLKDALDYVLYDRKDVVGDLE
jgi:hypothetical protein